MERKIILEKSSIKSGSIEWPDKISLPYSGKTLRDSKKIAAFLDDLNVYLSWLMESVRDYISDESTLNRKYPSGLENIENNYSDISWDEDEIIQVQIGLGKLSNAENKQKLIQILNFSNIASPLVRSAETLKKAINKIPDISGTFKFEVLADDLLLYFKLRNNYKEKNQNIILKPAETSNHPEDTNIKYQKKIPVDYKQVKTDTQKSVDDIWLSPDDLILADSLITKRKNISQNLSENLKTCKSKILSSSLTEKYTEPNYFPNLNLSNFSDKDKNEKFVYCLDIFLKSLIKYIIQNSENCISYSIFPARSKQLLDNKILNCKFGFELNLNSDADLENTLQKKIVKYSQPLLSVLRENNIECKIQLSNKNGSIQVFYIIEKQTVR